jgi:hypothetical protein
MIKVQKMTFNDAFEALKKGFRVTRPEMGDSNLALCFIQKDSPIGDKVIKIPEKIDCNCIGIEKNGEINPYWSPTQFEIWADDWMIVE